MISQVLEFKKYLISSYKSLNAIPFSGLTEKKNRTFRKGISYSRPPCFMVLLCIMKHLFAIIHKASSINSKIPSAVVLLIGKK